MHVIQNLKIALRSLIRRPAFSLIIVLTIAIVTGTSVVIYSYIDALLLTPLPFQEPDRLVQVYSSKGDEQGLLSYPEWLDMQKELTLMEDIAGYRDGGRYNLSGDGKTPEELTTTFATSNLFKVLGFDPMIGDHWPETLDKRGSHTLMFTHEFWQRRFDGDPDMVGRQVTLDGYAGYSNYGVMPEGFSFPVRNEAFRAMAYTDRVVTSRAFRPIVGLARLRQGVSLKAFNEELQKFASAQQERHQESNLGVSFYAEPLEKLFVGNINGYLWLLAGAAIFLLIIATVNVSNLIVSQAIRQSKETAVRKVLGSTNGQLIRGFVTRSLLLSMTGSLIGLALSSYFISISESLVSQYLPYWIKVEINLSVLLYAFGLAFLLGLVTGLMPWLSQFAGSNLLERLKDGQHTTGSRKQNIMQRGFATLQIAVSILLLVGGGLLYRSFSEARQTNLGFDTEEKVTFRIALAWFKYSKPEMIRDFYELSTEKIAAVPGVESVTVNSILPLTDIVNTSTDAQTNFALEGQPEVEQAQNPFISVQRVMPNYFEVMDMNLLSGESFNAADLSAQSGQVVIDQQLAEKMWPGQSPLGQRIRVAGLGRESPLLTITGVVNDVKHQSITGENIPSVYVSILAHTEIDAYYVVKTSGPLQDLTPRLTETILSIDENQPTFEYMTMEDRVADNNWQSMVSSVLFLAIALIGSVTAAVGLFSIITFILLMKLKELALRRVLGASGANILNLALKDVLKISGVGIVIGLALAPLLLRPIQPFLFEVSLLDVTVYVMATLGLVLISALASVSPIRRAMLINPVKALRKD